MKCTTFVVLGLIALSAAAYAQAPTDPIEKALLAAPRNLKEGATVIKWKPDFTYETLKKGTNKLVCYDLSGQSPTSRFGSNAPALRTLIALLRT